MGQCKKILKNGERCSNRAVPGADYCKDHKRKFTFRRIDPTPPPPEPAPGGPKPPDWTARPWTPPDDPAFPSLQPDERGILTAPEALIRLTADDKPDADGALFQRLTRTLSALSQALRLAGRIAIREYDVGRTLTLRIAPDPAGGADRSRLFDALSAAADMADGDLFIGEGRAFIRYRDDHAPRGYDAADVQPPKNDRVCLIDVNGTRVLNDADATEIPLPDLLLRIPTVPARGAEPPETAWALTEPRAHAMLARYFQAHHLRCRTARFRDPDGAAFALFRLTPDPEAPTGARIPRFVLSYLKALPRCAVMVEADADADRRLLTAWGRRHPCRSVLESFPPDSLILFPDSPDFASRVVSPTPAFFDSEDFLRVETAPGPPAAAPAETGAQDGPAPRPVTVPFRLVPAAGPGPFPAALVLDEREMEWLRRLVHRAPGQQFHRYALCRGTPWSILLGRDAPIEGIPFGIPLRSVRGAHLFIPVRSRLAPDLSWDLLVRVLDIPEGTNTFLTDRFRLDAPQTDFKPLSRALVADPDRPRTAIKLAPPPDLPPLKWTPPAEEADDKPRRILPFRRSSNKTKPAESAPSADAKGDDTETIRRRAAQFQENQDYLSAGFCYTLIQDPRNAARCFKSAALSTGEDE